MVADHKQDRMQLRKKRWHGWQGRQRWWRRDGRPENGIGRDVAAEANMLS